MPSPGRAKAVQGMLGCVGNATTGFWTSRLRDDMGVSSDTIVLQREDVRPHSRGAMRPSFASIAAL